MGSCASVHKDLGFPSSPPLKEKAMNGKGGGGAVGDVLVDLKRKIEGQAGFGGSKSPDSGSKDEFFFESQAWLDSDCEDDFVSVNGDFTPSRGSTPNYQPRTQTVMSNVFLPDNIHNPKSSEPSPTGRRKLADLLQEASQNGPGENTDTTTREPGSSNNGQQQPQSVAGAGKPVSESSSGCSMEPTPIREVKSRKERAWYTGRCCLPTFVHSLTLEDERRQKASPGPCAV
ncbi:uncharacterized protein At3g27210 [Brachypodium distachyon]|uniref:Uncharacterized protein n=1 Tax=Brachypodium distachyon TaxID=15368 RepID=I1HUM7_BRADI|nr:uncharacterized protein At3g27210 [Brachypodium distachyon]KQK11238.1 hypothetical protein BRADI_2g58950v3 [Brachypodium distachyon]KQK11239.1 hypothetical protein BRADI_2g58950v3 [Brachypodium distachyon]|eukprot:XP_010232752.1 uncharacterized protein At3g27210 [Brachypodium distachyon]